MPEKAIRWPPFSRQRNKASGQSLRLYGVPFAADIMAVRLQKRQSTQRCAPLSAQFIRDLRLRRN